MQSPVSGSPVPTAIPAHGVRDLRQRPTVSILASDLSQQGAGRWGGAAVRPFLLAQALQRVGYGVEVVGFTTDDSTLSMASNVTIRAVPIASPQWGQGDIRRLFAHLRGEIIYAYKPKPGSFGLALLHRLWHRRPLVLDIDDWELSWHGGDDWRYRPSLRRLARDVLKPNGELRRPDHPLYLKWLEQAVPYADRITTHNGFLQKRFGGVYVPNGKDTDEFDPTRYDPEASRQEYGLSGYRVIMFPGAPRPYKGVEDLLQALDVLDEPDLKLVIVGGSPYDDYDRHLLDHWPQRIIHLGQQPYGDMPKVVAAAHIIAVPQRNVPAAQAQFPLKLTDGMAMAKPILATRVGDIPQILGDTGYLAQPDSPHDLATQLRAMFADWPTTEALGPKARARCCEHYSMAAMATQLDQLLTELVPSRPNP